MDSEWALEVMHKAPYITVSFIDEDGKPYGLPLSLASDDNVNWYFHGALEGKKLEAIKAHPEVCLSAVTRCAPTVGPKDGSFTLQFKSAIAFGKAEIVTDEAEKIHGLRLICERFLPQHMDAFDESIARSLSRTAVVRISRAVFAAFRAYNSRGRSSFCARAARRCSRWRRSRRSAR